MVRLFLLNAIMLFQMDYLHGLNDSEISFRSPSGCPLEPVKRGDITPVKLVYATNDNITLTCRGSNKAYYVDGMYVKQFQQIPSRICQLNGTWSGPSWMCLRGSQGSSCRIRDFQLSLKEGEPHVAANVSSDGNCLTISHGMYDLPIELQWNVSFARPFALNAVTINERKDPIGVYAFPRDYAVGKLHAFKGKQQLNHNYCGFSIVSTSPVFIPCDNPVEYMIDKLSVSLALNASILFNAYQPDRNMSTTQLHQENKSICMNFYAWDAEDSQCPDPPLVLNAVLHIDQNRTEASYKCLNGYVLESSSGTGNMRCIQGLWEPRDPPRCSLQSTHSSGVGVSWEYFVIGFGSLLTGYLLGVVTLGCYVRRKNEKKKHSVPKPDPLINYNLHTIDDCRGGSSSDFSTRYEQCHPSAYVKPTYTQTFGQSSTMKRQEEEAGSEPIYSNSSSTHIDDEPENIYANM